MIGYNSNVCEGFYSLFKQVAITLKNPNTKLMFQKLKFLIFISIIFQFFLFRQNVKAQDFNVQFEHISIEQGLSQSSVFAICQDHKGFIWLGTHDGLNRFDGYNFKIYKNSKNDSLSISGNIIKAIYETKDSVLVVGTFGNGLNLFHRNSETFSRFIHEPNSINSLSNNSIRCIAEDKHGILWIGTEGGGLNRFDKKNKTFKSYQHNRNNENSLCQNEVNDIVIDKKGMLWLATNGGLDMFEPSSEKFTHFKHNPKDNNSLSNDFLPCVYEDSRGQIWVGSREGLNIFEPKTQTFKKYAYQANQPNGLCNNVVLKIMEDSQGFVWIGTSDGVSLFDPRTTTFYTYQHNSFDTKSLSHNNIASLYKDAAGIIWIGTWERGVNKFDILSKKFKLYKYSNSLSNNSLPDKTIRSVFAESNDIVWIGYVEGGLVRFDRKTNKIDRYQKIPYDEKTLYDNTVSSILRDSEGILWIGTWNGGIQKAIFSETDKTKIVQFEHLIQSNSGLISNTIQKIFESSDHKIWIGTAGGVDVFDKKSNTFLHIINFPNTEKGNIQGAMQEDRQGNIWVGSWGGLHKIYKTDNGNYQSKLFTHNEKDSASLNDNRIISLYIDKNNVIWAGTFGSGLNKIEIQNNKHIFKHYTQSNGLSNNVVYAVFDENNGNLWLSTNKGLSKFEVKTEKFTNYDESDGLQSNEFFWGAACKSSSGELFFGGINGLNAFYPANIQDNAYFPPVVITDFKMFNTSIKIGYNSLLKQSITETKKIILNFNDKVISFEFSALHFSVPENNKYAYKLEGFNKDWIYTDAKNRTATYTNLDPGHYVFKVKGSNSDGVWNLQGTEIVLVVKPPFWAEWWFRILVFVVVVGLIYRFLKSRINRIKKQKIHLEQLVKERTQEIELKNEELEVQKEEIQSQSDALSEIIVQLGEQNETVRMQNELITGSIKYAKTIQQSILPQKKELDSYFDNFILYKPKNIVSGDFYWFFKSEYEKGKEYLFFATVDCTGHGVPGAFMSLIGSRLLNEIVKDEHIYQPSRILEALDQGVRLSLNQETGDNNDGMDIALCRIEKNTEDLYQIVFSGAKISLLIYKSKTKTVERLKGSRKHIGGFLSRNKELVFSDFEFEATQNDIIYLSSDGFADQNNKEREKFGFDKFTELLNKHAELPMKEQLNGIEKALSDFQINEEQRDDITVVGLRFV